MGHYFVFIITESKWGGDTFYKELSGCQMETGLRRAREEGISVDLLKAGPGSTQGSGIRDAAEAASLRKEQTWSI